MQHAHGEFHVFLVDDDGNLDLRRRDHLNVDPLFRQRAKRGAGDARVRAHADADHRHLGDLVAALYRARVNVCRDRLQRLEHLLVVVAMHGKREIGESVVTDVLHDHVDVDIGVTDWPEDLVGDAGTIGHAQDRYFRFVAIERNA